MEEVAVLKAGYRAREQEEKRSTERRRSIITLILRYMCDNGYTESYERLCSESGISLNKYNAADNVDLDHIIQEFEWSFESKFGKKVKLINRVTDQLPVMHLKSASTKAPLSRNASTTKPPEREFSPSPESPSRSGAAAARDRRGKGAADMEQRRQDSGRRQREMASRLTSVASSEAARISAAKSSNANPSDLDFRVQGIKQQAGGQPPSSDEEPEDFFARRMLKPLPVWLSGELRELGAAIQRDILVDCPSVRWEDISGLHDAKRLLKEAVVMPLKYPQLFTGILTPWKGVLLYGPPGTGKTLLAKAVATECRTTFFNISASSIISKWRGDSEKLVRVLFDLARHHAPSTIFLDEVDALMGARGGEGEHEASRRMKTELLVQLDGLAGSSEQVFLLAASNLPWELDPAMLRRLEKRILVPLPDDVSRADMFSALLAGRTAPDVSFVDMAARTAGFSGSDIRLAAKEAAMRPLRRLMQQLEARGGAAAGCRLEVGPTTLEDVDKALAATKPTGQQHEEQYRGFSLQYGQVL